MSITLNDLLKKVENYNPEELGNVEKAYEYAKVLHQGQLRESREAYISHPLNVAYILACMHADGNTIQAALLYDTLEDTKITKEDISHDFNQDVANLVDGVTKLAKMNFSSKSDQNLANTRKIITGITNDVRIIIIKLADRLHNMQTLEFKSELEDLSLRYLKPEMYKKIEERKQILENESVNILKEITNF